MFVNYYITIIYTIIISETLHFHRLLNLLKMCQNEWSLYDPYSLITSILKIEEITHGNNYK